MVCKTGTEEDSLHPLKGTLWQQLLWAFKVTDWELSKLGSDGCRLSPARISLCLVAITHTVRRGRREMRLCWEAPLTLFSLADIEEPTQRSRTGMPWVCMLSVCPEEA